MRWFVHISYYSFAMTIGIGLPFILAVRGFFRLMPEYPRTSAITMSVILALMFTPTVWDPFHQYYVEAVAIVLLFWVAGFEQFSYAVLHGIVPFCLGVGLFYWALLRRQLRSAKS